MNKRLLFILLLISFLGGCRLYKDNDPLKKELPKATAQKDFKIFIDILKKAHPSLNLYITEKRLNFLMDSLNNSITEEVTLQNFYNKLTVVINEIGCAHTDIDLPDYIYDTLNSRKYFFPFPVSFIEDKLLVNATGLSLPEGTEIKRINGEPVKNVLNHLMRYNSVEGRHRNTQLQLAASRFEMQYYLCYGKQENFKLEIVDTFGIKKEWYGKPVTLKDVRDQYRNAEYYFDATDADYNCYFSKENNYAFLKISTFSFDRRQQQTAYENFCNNTFDLIQYKKPATLVIDLRENTGGSLYNAFLLYSYIAKKPFKEFEKVYSKIRTVPYSEYYSEDFSTADETDINDRLEESFKQRTKENYYAIPDSLLDTWKPDNYHYGGKIYIITNCQTASSASYFATMVKNSGVGKIIGETACGGSYSGNGYSSLSYTLPGSHIKFYFPYAHLVYTFKDEKNTGNGLTPDYYVPNSYKSFKSNSDEQMNFLIDSLILK